MSVIDRTQPHVTVTIGRSMVGVEPGTGIPGLEQLTPAIEKAGFKLLGFESRTPDDDLAPKGYEAAHAKLAEIAEIARDAAQQLVDTTPYDESMGDPAEYDGDVRDDVLTAFFALERAVHELDAEQAKLA